jgi:GNAT superfamily N-acetyltransferase
MTHSKVLEAATTEDLRKCFPVIAQLRPTLDIETFLGRVTTQRDEGYRVIFLVSGDAVAAVAGFRFLHCLALGKFMYIDDFVTDLKRRGQGLGSKLFNWLELHARDNGCSAVQLDSGIQREAAQQFYAAMKMEKTCNHFTKIL